MKLDLDKLEPKVINDEIARNASLKKGWRTFKFTNPSSYRKVGIDPRKLLDWRALEVKYVTLQDRARDFNIEYWDRLNKLYRAAREKGLNHVWVLDPNSEHVIEYDGDTICSREFNKLLKQQERETDERNGGLIVSGDEATNLQRLTQRDRVLSRRSHVYLLAFKLAIEVRLKSVVEARRTNYKHRRFYNPAMFIVRNEERQYLLTLTDTGALAWADSRFDVFEAV